MVTAIKHGLPRSVNSYNPFYITTNKVPDFKDENDNVQLRIHVFNTTSLPKTLRGVDLWMYDNAMHCIAWIADQLNKHHDLLDAEELWYECARNNAAILPCQSSNPQWKRAEILQITHADLESVEHPSLRESDDAAIYTRFLSELRSRRLARKRQRRRRIPSTEGSSDEDIPTCSKFSPRDHTQQSINGSPPSTSHAQFEESSGENEPFLPHDKHQPEHDRNDDNERHDQATPHVQSSEATPVAQPMSQRQTVLDQPCTSTGITYDVQQANLSDNTPKRWTLNNDSAYMTKVAHLIKLNFNKDLQEGHVHSFTERMARNVRQSHYYSFIPKALCE